VVHSFGDFSPWSLGTIALGMKQGWTPHQRENVTKATHLIEHPGIRYIFAGHTWVILPSSRLHQPKYCAMNPRN
jgi:hypothetical protein